MDRIPPAEEWEEVVPYVSVPPPSAARTRAWALVLAARGIEHRLLYRGTRAALRVPAAERARAEAELRCYETENRRGPPPPVEAPTVPNERRTFAVLVVLGLFHDLTFQPPGTVFGLAVDWHRLGSMAADRVLAGEWWRLVTALTLHADGLHLAGNLLLGGVLLVLVNRQLGIGVGVALTLAAGVLGNLANALAQGPSHHSVGASTAVFGALGLLVARAPWRDARRDWRRWVAPLGAGAGLIALTGVGGERTDYTAHLFGFLWGGGIGLLTRWPVALRGVPGRLPSWSAGLVALAVIVGCWTCAVLNG